jgi:hypothetical protein
VVRDSYDGVPGHRSYGTASGFLCDSVEELVELWDVAFGWLFHDDAYYYLPSIF